MRSIRKIFFAANIKRMTTPLTPEQRERKRIRDKEYRERNKDKIAAYREATREQHREANRRHYEANKEKYAAYKKQWRIDNRERFLEQHRRHNLARYYRLKAERAEQEKSDDNSQNSG